LVIITHHFFLPIALRSYIRIPFGFLTALYTKPLQGLGGGQRRRSRILRLLWIFYKRTRIYPTHKSFSDPNSPPNSPTFLQPNNNLSSFCRNRHWSRGPRWYNRRERNISHPTSNTFMNFLSSRIEKSLWTSKSWHKFQINCRSGFHPENWFESNVSTTITVLQCKLRLAHACFQSSSKSFSNLQNKLKWNCVGKFMPITEFSSSISCSNSVPYSQVPYHVPILFHILLPVFFLFQVSFSFLSASVITLYHLGCIFSFLFLWSSQGSRGCVVQKNNSIVQSKRC